MDTSSGERVEHEGRLLGDGLPPVASSASTALLSLAVFLVLGLWHGESLRASLAMAASCWALFTVADLVRRRQRVSITVRSVVVRTWRGRTVSIPRESVAHVLHLRRPGSRSGLLSLLDEKDLPLWRFWTEHWSDETVAALLDVGRRSTVEDVGPEEDEPVSARESPVGAAARLVLHGLLVAFSVACLLATLLLIASAWLEA